MADMSIRFAESAVADLEAIKRWYADQGVPHVGDRFLDGVFERVERLREHPDIGRTVPEFGQSFLRELIYPPFRIVYHRGHGERGQVGGLSGSSFNPASRRSSAMCGSCSGVNIPSRASD